MTSKKRPRFVEADHLTILAPLDGWLLKLAQGWQFCEGGGPLVLGNLHQPHAWYSVMMWREA